jgi:hypothetical protein
LIRYFKEVSYLDLQLARRFQVSCDLPPRECKDFNIVLDLNSKYFIKAFRKDIAASKKNIILNFAIKHNHAGFLATAFRT